MIKRLIITILFIPWVLGFLLIVPLTFPICYILFDDYMAFGAWYGDLMNNVR